MEEYRFTSLLIFIQSSESVQKKENNDKKNTVPGGIDIKPKMRCLLSSNNCPQDTP